jgi:signal transduction histidine kinase
VLWQTTLLAGTLVLAASLAVWAAVIARSRRGVPGSAWFAWLMVAVAHWSLSSALHTLVDDAATRITISKIQYIGIAPIGALWILFTSSYARLTWPMDPVLRYLIWVVPAITLAAAFSNESHHLLWASISPATTSLGTRLVYSGGPWYWVHVVYNYSLIIVGALTLMRGLRRSPPPYRWQTLAIVAGAFIPLAVNVLYLSRVLPVVGLDLTPLAFTVSGLCFIWGLYRFRLFGLVPIARDMVVDSMEDGVLVLDAHRRIVDLNAAAERLTGCTRASVGRPVDEVVSWWNDAAEQHPAPGLPAVVKTEPGPRYFEVKVTPVRDPERRFAGWLILVHDVTMRRRVDADRYALDRRMQEQQKAESLTVLAAGVAHDFNNLLTGILGNADLLAMQAAPDSTEKHAAEAIVIGAQRAADLVSKMLAYAGEGRVVSERVNLDELVREMVDLLEASVGRHCTLRYTGSSSLPAIEADPTGLRQVIMNLIINATEAVDEGGVVTVATGEESLDRVALANMTFGSGYEPGRYVFLDVVDNGHGISDETLARVFDPFFSTKQMGRGLGLAAVRGIVRMHQAPLRVTSKAGQGTRFRVWFPLIPPQRRV